MAVPLSRGHIIKGNLATSPATSPVQRTPQTTWTHSGTWRTQKFTVASRPSPRHCSIPWVGQLQDFFPDLDPNNREKKPRGFLESRAQALVMASHLEPGSGHRTSCGHGQPWSSSEWSAGNLAFTSSALFALLCPHLALPRARFCPPKNME